MPRKPGVSKVRVTAPRSNSAGARLAGPGPAGVSSSFRLSQRNGPPVDDARLRRARPSRKTHNRTDIRSTQWRAPTASAMGRPRQRNGVPTAPMADRATIRVDRRTARGVAVKPPHQQTCGVDTSIPNVARMYDYFLGGKDNFAADREAAEKIIALAPGVPAAARRNRAFLGRAVRFLRGEGIRQFLDIGTGLPTRSNVHEIAQGMGPQTRVVYVDNDPVVVSHGKALVAGSDTVCILQADLRRPDEIVSAPEVRSHIDFSQPVAVLLLAVLHFIPDSAGPAAIVARFRDAMAPGSYLALSHGSVDTLAPSPTPTPTLAQAQTQNHAVTSGKAVYDRASASVFPRSREQILAFFDGFDLVEPGLVPLAQWRPDGTLGGKRSYGYGGVARKPSPD